MANTTDERQTTPAGRRARLMLLTDVVEDDARPWARSRSQLLRLCSQGRLHHRKIGKSFWVSDEDLNDYEDSEIR